MNPRLRCWKEYILCIETFKIQYNYLFLTKPYQLHSVKGKSSISRMLNANNISEEVMCVIPGFIVFSLSQKLLQLHLDTKLL